MPKYAKKRDDNEREIIDVLQKVGARVFQLNEQDIPDLLVEFRRKWWLIEVKGKQGKLEHGQQRFFENSAAPVAVARTPGDALCAIGAKKY